MTSRIEDQPLERRAGVGFGIRRRPIGPQHNRCLVELGLHGLEEVSVDDWLVLARVRGCLVWDLTEIEPVAQKVEQRSARHRPAAGTFAGLANAAFGNQTGRG
jgi:hypothetical protein